jgi:endonuclease/exonuclease/phosphatase (EEP) superfamily protein YafD
MIRKVLAAFLLLVAAAILLVAVWPELFGLQSAPIVAQVVSLRGLDVAIAIGLMVVFGLISIGWRGARRFFGSLIVLLLVFCLLSLAILASRGFGGSSTSAASASSAAKSTSDITVLSWNTQGDGPGAGEIARVAVAEHADVVTLPETTLATGVDVATLMKAAGRPMWVYSGTLGNVYQSHSTTLLISAALGKYTVDTHEGDTSVLASIIARPDSGTGPTIVAVHAVSPKPDEMLNWRSDLAFLAKRCSGSNLIMAGDFNSTLDELEALSTKAGADFGQCYDAGYASKSAAIGSWPTSLPPLLGAQIDHVMYTSAWRTVSMKVVQNEDQAGSDHRPIVAVLAPSK